MRVFPLEGLTQMIEVIRDVMADQPAAFPLVALC